MAHLIAGIFAILLILTIPTISAFGQTLTVSKVPVIILFKENPTDKHVNLIKSVGGEITRTYKIINGFAANLPQTSIENLKHNLLISSIDPDLEVKAIDTSADIQIRADQVWAAGDTGQGIPVAILDTGIDTIHPEFSGRILNCHSEITNTNTCTDGNGHGTHTAGIAAATGANLQAKGVAPSASLYIDQVLDSTGSGTISGVIAGIEWANGKGAKVISMSLGTSPISKTEPNCDTVIPSLTTAINNAVSAGATVVAAAGNSGRQGVGAPACISSTIAVGAVDSTDTIASFSSVGGPMQDHGIAAPGVNIFSTWLADGYATLSGTSMATPSVSGTVALLLKANSALTPTTIRNVLFNTACTSSTTPSCPTGSVPNTVYGYGRVDALSAYNAVSTPLPPPSPDFSISASPNTMTIQQGSSSTSAITVTSLGGFNSAVTLSVSGNPTGVTTTFSANPVTPPSGGSITSTLTINVDPTTLAGGSTLTVTGNSGSLTHTATIALNVSPPAPTLSVSVSTDKTTYTQKSFAFITVAVTNSSPVGGASVVVTVTNPSGGSAQGSGTTDSTGHVVFKYRIGPNAPLGTYTVTAQASKTGFNSGTGTTTFSVQ